jgi:hypothetical protein
VQYHLSLPLSCGNTKPIALAAPVELGIMLAAAARPRLDKYLFYVVDPLSD